MDISIRYRFTTKRNRCQNSSNGLNVMNENKFSYEVVFVNDGSTDKSWEVVEALQKRSENVRGIKSRHNYGKSPALYCGFRAAQGDVVITMDADLQDSPDEIPELFEMVKNQNYDLVSGWKKKRYDSKLTKTFLPKYTTPLPAK